MTDFFPTATPESCGVKSEWVKKFVSDLERHHLMMHSILLARKGKIFAEGYYAPFRQDELHRMYSTSKSFTGTAIGALIGEGKLSLADKIVRFFPDMAERYPIHPYLAETTVRDLLIMATPFDTTTYVRDAAHGNHADNWVRSFFEAKATHPAGSFFRYDTSATYILGVIAERITGKRLMDYLKETVLKDTGFSPDATCYSTPEGHSWCGSAVLCSTRDMARLAQIYLDGGQVNGRQVLPAQYVREAITPQISNAESGAVDWLHGRGYGYQIWCTFGEGFAFNGMGGQFVFCFPKSGLLFACTADIQGNAPGLNLIFEALWRNIVSQIGEPLPENAAENEKLQRKLAHLVCAMPIGAPDAPGRAEIDGRWFTLNENPLKLSRMMLEWQGDGSVWHFVQDGVEKTLPFGTRQYAESIFPQTNYYGDTVGVPSGKSYRCMTAGVWSEERKFTLRMYIIDMHLGNLTVTFGFKGNQVGIDMEKTAVWFLDEYKGILSGFAEE